MATENDPMPEIPSFRKTQEKEKKGAGIPLLGRGSGGKPVLRIRGLGAGTTLVERLRQFSRKDLAFIVSGLGILFMAPLAEHFLLGPSEEGNVLRRGFDNKGNFFSEANPYEPGAGGMSPGGLPGQASDVITPLNVRDPSALVMSPGATQQTPPPAAPPAAGEKEKGNWKDALEEAGRAGGRGAFGEGGLGPKGTLKGELPSLSSFLGGGGGPTWSLSAPSASNVPNRPGAGPESLSQVQAAPGYKGAGPRGISSGGNIDALKAAAAGQAGIFNREGGAANSLEEAARQGIPGGGAGWSGGGPGGGPGAKEPGGNQNHDNKSLGESLEFMRRKEEMMKELALKWKKKEWNDFERWKMIQETGIKSLIGGPLEAVGKCVGDGLSGGLSGKGWKMCGPDDKDAPWICTKTGEEMKLGIPAKFAPCYTGQTIKNDKDASRIDCSTGWGSFLSKAHADGWKCQSSSGEDSKPEPGPNGATKDMSVFGGTNALVCPHAGSGGAVPDPSCPKTSPSRDQFGGATDDAHRDLETSVKDEKDALDAYGQALAALSKQAGGLQASADGENDVLSSGLNDLETSFLSQAKGAKESCSSNSTDCSQKLSDAANALVKDYPDSNPAWSQATSNWDQNKRAAESRRGDSAKRADLVKSKIEDAKTALGKMDLSNASEDFKKLITDAKSTLDNVTKASDLNKEAMDKLSAAASSLDKAATKSSEYEQGYRKQYEAGTKIVQDIKNSSLEDFAAGMGELQQVKGQEAEKAANDAKTTLEEARKAVSAVSQQMQSFSSTVDLAKKK